MSAEPVVGGAHGWGAAVKTGAFEVLCREGLYAGERAIPGNWLADPDRVVFSTRLGDDRVAQDADTFDFHFDFVTGVQRLRFARCSGKDQVTGLKRDVLTV